MVLTASVSTVVLSLLSMGATFQFAKRVLANSVPREALRINATTDIGGMAAVFLMLLPVAVMLSAALLMVGLFSKSFREAQSYAGPLMLVMIVPAIAAMPQYGIQNLALYLTLYNFTEKNLRRFQSSFSNSRPHTTLASSESILLPIQAVRIEKCFVLSCS